MSPPLTFYQCGIIEKLAGIPDGYQGQVFYDRFGNTWTVPELQALSANSTDVCDAGAFKLQFKNVPANYQATICQVFTYVSTTIGGGNVAKVPIQIDWVVLNEDFAAEATSFQFYSDCNRVSNTVQQGIRNSSTDLPLGAVAGLVRINSAVNWYDGPANAITSGTTDLYTAVLHEALHLLGVASLIGDTGSTPHYTEYDRYLAHKTGAGIYEPLIINVPDVNCCSVMADNPASTPNLLLGCEGEIFFTNDAGSPTSEILEVAYLDENDNPGSLNNIPNKLSHFDIDCGGAHQYVMHPGVGVYPNDYSTPRRIITPPELEVLCRIGYPAAGGCSNCALLVQDDDVTNQPIFLFNANGTPNQNPEIDLYIDLSVNNGSNYNLLSNDITPPLPNAIFELITPHPGLNITEVEFNIGVPGYLKVIITDNTPGIKTFTYKMTACGQCQYATVYIQVLEKPVSINCDADPDCNLVCFGDFEEFDCGNGIYYPQLGTLGPVFTEINDELQNTVDVFTVSDPGGSDNLIGWIAESAKDGGWGFETVVIPLSSAIPPDCKTTVSYETSYNSISANQILFPLPTGVKIEIYGLTGNPCNQIDIVPQWESSDPLGSSFQLCNGVTAYRLSRNENPPFNPSVILDDCSLSNLDMSGFLSEYQHPPNAAPITHFLIFTRFNELLTPPISPAVSHRAFFLLDNLYVTSDCNNQITVTPTVTQACQGGQAIIKYDVCLQGNGASAPVQLQASVPPAYQQFVSFVPGGGFNANGLATFNLTPGADCNGGSNTTTLTLTVNLASNITAGTLLDLNMAVVSGNTCINSSTSDGDVVLLVQDCAIDLTACKCAANTNNYTVGANQNSTTDLSATALPSSITGHCISVNGKLKVNGNLSLDNCTVIMNKGAEIEIQGSKLLRLTNGTSLYGCNHMWKGITVLEQGKLYVEGTATAKVSISDAQYAVKPLNGSEIKLVHAIFDKNYIDFHASSNANLISVTLESVANCSFTASGALKPAYNGQSPVPGTSPYAAFNLKNVTGINFGSKAPNTIDQHRFGLRADRSSFSMSNTTMSDFVGGNSDKIGVYANLCANATVKDCNIKGYIQGVKSIRSNTEVTGTKFNFETPSTISTIGIEIQAGPGKVTKIQKNIIERSGFGIKIIESYGYNGSDVFNNTIRNFYIPTALGTNKPSAIDLNTVTNFSISTNNIGDGSTGDNHTGITMYRCIENFVVSNTINSMMRGISNNSGLLNFFQENTIQKALLGNDLPGEGFYVSGSTDGYCYNTTRNLTSDGFLFLGGCDPSIVAQSQIYGAATGLRIFANNSAIGEQNNRKNRWFGPFSSGFGAFHEGTDFNQINQSRFYTQQQLVPTWNTNAGNSVGWFQLIPNDPPGVPPTCSDYPSSGKTSSNDGKTALGDYSGPFADAYTWEARLGLYRRIQADASVINNNTAVASFYQQSADAPVGRFAFARQATQDLLALNQNLRQQFYNGSAQAVALNEQLDAALAQPQPDWATVRLLQLQLHQNTTRFLALDKGYGQKQTNALPTVKNLMNNLADVETYQTNEKMVWQYILDEQLWLPEAVPSVTALERLESTAAQCAIAGGNGVYVARSLLLRWGIDRNWDDRELCIAEKERTDNAEPTSGWLVVPNPVRDMLAFQHSSPLIEEGQITVFNTLGAVVLQANLTQGQRQVAIPVANWANGLYYYQIEVSNTNKQKGTFIIQH